MIVISERGKGLVFLESWEDMYTRPGFIEKVDPSTITMKEIIGQYRLPPEKHPCGLSTCHQPHFNGYLVLLEEGGETNIGGDCGKRYFGVVFESHEKSFKQQYNAQRSRENITAQQNRIEPIREQVQRLKDGDFGADDLYKRMNALMSRQFDDHIINKLKDRAKARKSVVANVRRFSEEEIDDLRAIGDTRDFEEIPVFTIAGLAAVADYKKLRTMLGTKLGSELDAFEQIDPNELDLKELRRWSNWANKIDNRLKDARNIMEDCKRFLVPSNIEQIRRSKGLL